MNKILTQEEEDFNQNCDFVEMEIDISKAYNFPSEIHIHKYGDVFLVIYTEGVMWMVMKNKDEVDVFKMLAQGYKVNEVLERFDESVVINVLTQIEAKKFYEPVFNENNEKNICIYLTNNCNQKCKHCYMYAGEIDIEEININKWIKILDEFKINGGKGVTFTGGEITVYNGFDKIIRYAHNIGLLVTVLSNGILWTKGMISNLHKYIDEIQISIDGYDSESYYMVRQSDGFDKAIECILNFINVGTKVSMAVTPLYDNIEKFISKFEIFAKMFIEKYPSVFIKLNLELIEGRTVSTTKEENMLYREKIKGLMERIYAGYYTEMFVLNFENNVRRKNCGFGEISISPNGDVFWCNRIYELQKATNILDVDFKSIMKISEDIKKKTSVCNTNPCKKCDIKYICGGGCRIKYNNIKNVDTYEGEWEYECEEKDSIYNRMVLCNEYFYK